MSLHTPEANLFDEDPAHCSAWCRGGGGTKNMSLGSYSPLAFRVSSQKKSNLKTIHHTTMYHVKHLRPLNPETPNSLLWPRL